MADRLSRKKKDLVIIAVVLFSFSSLCLQVFLLDSQVDKPSTHKQDTPGPANEEDDQRSYVFVLSSVENKEKPENAER